MDLKNDIKLVSKISTMIKDLKNTYRFSSENLSYDILTLIWFDFIAKEFKIRNEIYNPVINFAKNEEKNSHIIEDLFASYLFSSNEDLIMFYKKGENEILYFLKSWQILAEIDDLRLPFFTIKIPSDNINNKLSDTMKDNEWIVCAC